MNNNTKAANIMTWSKFKKLFNPPIYYTTDDVFGTKSKVEPTLLKFGFKKSSKCLLDIDEEYNYNPPKPLNIVKDKIDIFKYTYIVYYVWTWRDKHGKGIDIFYI